MPDDFFFNFLTSHSLSSLIFARCHFQLESFLNFSHDFIFFKSSNYIIYVIWFNHLSCWATLMTSLASMTSLAHWPQWPQWPLLSLWPQKIQKLLGIYTMRDFLTSTTFSTSLASIASTASVASMRPKVFSLKKLVENNSFFMPGAKTTIFGWFYCQKPRYSYIFDTFLIWGCWGCVRSKKSKLVVQA